MLTSLNCKPELEHFRATRDRFYSAQADFEAALAKLKALSAAAAPPAPERRPTLIGVAPPSRPLTQQRAAFVAAALGSRPSGRY